MNKELENLINKYSKIGIFSGAGVSANSGIPTFRGDKSMPEYNGISPMDIMSKHYFHSNKASFWNFLNDLQNKSNKKPNSAHYLALTLHELNKLSGVVTQNIDGLYQKTNLPNDKIIEIHGNLNYGICSKCKMRYKIKDLTKTKKGIYLSPCHKDNIIKPDIILYGDSFLSENIRRYQEILDNSQLLIVMGTGLDISFHLNKISYFPGDIALINKDDVYLSTQTFNRKWDFKLLGDFNELL